MKKQCIVDYDASSESDTDYASELNICTVPHTRGNWPTHVYIPIEQTEDLIDFINNIGERLKEIVPTIQSTIESEKDYLHISISRCLYFKEFQLSPFLDGLRTRLSLKQKFLLNFGRISWYVNDEGTRSFLSLDVTGGFNDVLYLSKQVDQVAQAYHQPTFYLEPRFHISIYSARGNLLNEDVVSQLNTVVFNTGEVQVERILVKMGNRQAEIKLLNR